jgi:hypothetical protein
VALKILNPDRAEEAPRFLREARAAASLHHANVVSVYDMGEAAGVPYIAMELVEGRLLSEFAGTAAGVCVAEKVRWLIEVARGIQASHEAGLLHRDIKPHNVIVTKAGSVKLLDFGLAKPTEEAEPTFGPFTRPDFKTRVGFVVGSPRYMAPEALRGGTCDGRADQFSWGVTAYELIAGVHPRGGVADPVGLHPPRLLSELVPEVSFPLAAAIARTLAGDPDNRFADMGALIGALANPSTARPRGGQHLGDTVPGGDEIAATEAAPPMVAAAGPTGAEAPATIREPAPMMGYVTRIDGGTEPRRAGVPAQPARAATRRAPPAFAATMQSPQVSKVAASGAVHPVAQATDAAERRARTVPRTGGGGVAQSRASAAPGLRKGQLIVAVVVVGLGLGIVAAALVVQRQTARGDHAPVVPGFTRIHQPSRGLGR